MPSRSLSFFDFHFLSFCSNQITDRSNETIALSFDASPVRLNKYLPTIPDTHSIVVFVGAMAHGPDNFADHMVDEKIAISEYSLSASVACGKVSRRPFLAFFIDFQLTHFCIK